MKRKYFFIPQAHKWNTTVHKFLKLHKRITTLKAENFSEDVLSKLVKKLEGLYRRLEKLQYGVGVKLAGATLSLMFLSATATAQNFSYKNTLQQPGDIKAFYVSTPTFADIDNDGDLDLFIGEYGGYVTEFTNVNGEYVKKGYIQADGADLKVSKFPAPALADIDGDGDLDLFVGEYYGGVIAYTNDGSGNFSIGDTIAKVSKYAGPTFADIDGDGDLDLFVGERYGTVVTFTNDGSGNFATTGDTLKAAGNNVKVMYIVRPVFADVDNDGDLDLFVGEYGGAITEFKNDGSGNFAAGVKVQADGSDISVGTLGYWSAPAIADLDGDGDLDLVSGEFYGYLPIYTNDGDTFKATGYMQGIVDLKTNQYSHPVFADIDGDGNLDLYSGDYHGNIILFKNTGDEYLAAGDTVKAGGANIKMNTFSSPTFTDIDSDGDLDLVSGEYNGGMNIIAFNNDGNGNFLAGDTLKAAGTAISVKAGAPAFADIDKDNDLDLFVGAGDGYILTFNNNGSGYDAGDTLILSTGDTLHTNNFAKPVFFDLDDDGNLDLLVGDRYGSIIAYKNDGNGKFNAGDTLQADGANIEITEGFATPAFADLDGNGKVDLYVGNKSGTFKFYENMLNTEFSAIDNSAEIKLYPNPTSNTITINADDSYNVTIMDLSGKEVFNGRMNSNTMTIDMSQYNAGIYLVKLSNENVVKTTKLVVE